MNIDKDENELARMLARVAEADFIRVIVHGHRKFRHLECRCDICLGKFETVTRTAQGGVNERATVNAPPPAAPGSFSLKRYG